MFINQWSRSCLMLICVTKSLASDFFSKVYGVKPESPLYGLGVKKEDVVLCEMLSHCHDEPVVRFFCPLGVVDVKNESLQLHTHAVYEGNEDLTGFICAESKSKAASVLATSPAAST